MTATQPGGSNTFIPSHAASGQLTVAYSRNVEDFALNKYLQIVPVDKNVGYYLELSNELAGRLLDPLLNQFDWPDNDDAPDGRGNTEDFDYKPFRTARKAYPFRVGFQAADQADWDVLAQHGKIMAQLAMTARTQKAITLITTSGNWPAAHTSAVSSIAGVTGKWDLSTTSRSDIKRSLDYGREQIELSTLAAVKPDDMMLLISPKAARLMSVSAEFVQYLKGSPDARDYIKGKLGPNAHYGLPDTIYGCKIVVENTAKVTSRKGATLAKSYVMSHDTPVLLSRPGDLVVPEGTSPSAPRFSTVSMFMKEEMTVEQMADANNRVHKGRVVEDFGVKITAPASGFLFTDAFDAA